MTFHGTDADRGTYRILNASPDGDSVRFYPDDPQAFARAGLAVQPNTRGGVQLRLEGIDALETHFTTPRGHIRWHQPAELGAAASTALLTALGFSDVVRDENLRVTAADPDQVPGYIPTRFADKYGRAVAFAFAGARPGPHPDDDQVFLDTEELAASVNHHLLTTGLVYPTFYSKLFPDLRAELAAAARTAGAGVWAQDVTTTGFTLAGRDQLMDEVVLLPKLFRRLAEYLATGDDVDLGRFSEFLQAHGDELFTVPAGHATHLDTLVEVTDQFLRLTVEPENIIFRDKNS
ncbi:nuclease [Rhodococcus sp. WS4]|nr:nuclease [Rhodococcus sp. WS4]